MLGLAGLADAYLVWSGFFADVLVHYVALRDTLFSIFPFSIASYVKDYLIVGLGVAAPYVRAEFGVITALFEGVFPGITKHANPYVEMVVLTLFYAIVWPLVIGGNIVATISIATGGYKSTPNELWEQPVTILFWTNIVLFLVVFIAIMFVFSDFAEKIFS